MQRVSVSACSLVRRNIHTSTIQRFDWQQLVDPWTKKETIEEWTNKQANLNAKQDLARSVPKTVEPIDWAEWEAAISTPGAVAQLKKEYESLAFKTYDISEYADEIAANEEAVRQKQCMEEINKLEVGHAQDAIDLHKKMQAKGHVGMTLEDHEMLYPGRIQQCWDEIDDEIYTRSDLEERNDKLDYVQLKEQFLAGQDVDIEKPERFGDTIFAEEEELKAKGEWSIQRLYCDRAQREEIHQNILKMKADALSKLNATA